jgi:hypothetical protein
MLEIGTRVRAHVSSGAVFPGKIGTVVHVGAFYHVDFDHIGKPGDEWANGGTWDESALIVVDDRVNVLEAALAEETAILLYAKSLLSESKRAKVDGYADATRKVVLP